MTAAPVISASSLDLTFQTGDGPVHALKGVDLDIRKGEFVSFIGPSGCGCEFWPQAQITSPREMV